MRMWILTFLLLALAKSISGCGAPSGPIPDTTTRRDTWGNNNGGGIIGRDANANPGPTR